MTATHVTTCIGCKLVLPVTKWPTHSYILSSPACWKLYGEVLAREYSDKAYWKVHRLTVDAYALQHPGENNRRAIQSVNVHLASLYLIFEKNTTYDNATQQIANIIKIHKADLKFIVPPESCGQLTILDVWKATTAQEHADLVRQWARSTYEAWSHHLKPILKLIT